MKLWKLEDQPASFNSPHVMGQVLCCSETDSFVESHSQCRQKLFRLKSLRCFVSNCLIITDISQQICISVECLCLQLAALGEECECGVSKPANVAGCHWTSCSAFPVNVCAGYSQYRFAVCHQGAPDASSCKYHTVMSMLMTHYMCIESLRHFISSQALAFSHITQQFFTPWFLPIWSDL